jgi:hypothetical protein
MRPCVLGEQSVHLVYVSYPSFHLLFQVGFRLRPRRVSGDLDSTTSDGHLKEEAGCPSAISHLSTVQRSHLLPHLGFTSDSVRGRLRDALACSGSLRAMVGCSEWKSIFVSVVHGQLPTVARLHVVGIPNVKAVKRLWCQVELNGLEG